MCCLHVLLNIPNKVFELIGSFLEKKIKECKDPVLDSRYKSFIGFPSCDTLENDYKNEYRHQTVGINPPFCNVTSFS